MQINKVVMKLGKDVNRSIIEKKAHMAYTRTDTDTHLLSIYLFISMFSCIYIDSNNNDKNCKLRPP